MALGTHSLPQDVQYFGEWPDIPILFCLYWYHARVHQKQQQYFGTEREMFIFVINNKQYLFSGTAWLKRLRNEVLHADPEKLLQNLQVFYPEFERVKKFLMARVKENWETKTDAQVASDFTEIYHQINSITCFDQYCMLSDRFYVEALEEYLRRQLGSDQSRFNEYRTLITTPTRLSATQAEELSLVKMAQKLQKANKDYSKIQADIQTHLRDFGWLPIFLIGKAWDEHYVRTELEKLLTEKDLDQKERAILDFGKEHVKATQQILSQFREQSLWPQLMQELGFIRNEGETLISLGTHVLRPAYVELSKRMKIAYSDLFCLTPEEIADFFKTGKRMDDEIRRRTDQGAVVFTDIHGVRTVSGDEALAFFKRVYHRPEKTVSNSLQGVCASVGKAKGPVHILNSIADLKDFKQGDVLVAEATCIDYVPAMRKAVAIVTELGGLTSHAAIVSRELGVPCVIGIRNVHHILKNGQIVLVDANAGKVTVVK